MTSFSRLVALGAGLAVLAGFALTSCSGAPDELEPPEMHYGEDLCTLCSMIISEERYAASIAYRSDGDVHHMLFDDLGELFDAEVPDHSEVEYYVHDAGTLEWIDARAAFFLQSDDLRTPMEYGLAAFADEARAREFFKEYPGEILSFEDLASR